MTASRCSGWRSSGLIFPQYCSLFYNDYLYFQFFCDFVIFNFFFILIFFIDKFPHQISTLIWLFLRRYPKLHILRTLSKFTMILQSYRIWFDKHCTWRYTITTSVLSEDPQKYSVICITVQCMNALRIPCGGWKNS